MSELFKEIEDDIQQERMQRLWHDFGKAMVAVSIGVILATVAVVVWQNHKQTVAQAQTSQFMKGLDRMNVEDYQGATQAFDVLTHDESSPYYGLAMLRKAQAQALDGDPKGAAETYRSLAKHGNGENKVFAALGGVMTTENSGDVQATTPGAPFHELQSEANAWALLHAGKKDEAVAIFRRLSGDKRAPSSERERAAAMLQTLAPGRTMSDER